MLQQRSLIARCSLACLIALVGLLAVSRLTVTAAALPAADVDDRSVTVTSTSPIDLLPASDSFVDTLVSLPGVQYGSANWGDCNNDGASDLLILGEVSSTLKIARVYQQVAGGDFTLTAVLSDVTHGAAAWGDYDNDGYLDIALTGEHAGVPISRLYHNMHNGCTFSPVAANLIGVCYSTIAWGDYNMDGQLDLLLAGDNGSQPVTKLYRNNHGYFSDSGLVLPGIQNGAAVWGDYNNDGLADLLLTGSITGNARLSKLYRNNGAGALIETPTALPALSNSAAAWGDYDNDGNLDLLLEGTQDGASPYIPEVYRNQQGTFVKNSTTDNLLGSLNWTGAAWGDYDSDGYLDALISSNDFATAYHNRSDGTFAAGLNVGVSVLNNGSLAWGHYDSDGALDVAVTGIGNSGRVTKIYRYGNLTSSAPPSAPRNLTATVTGSNVTLRWDSPTGDDHTSVPGLSYNLRIGTQPGGVDIIAPMANPGTGKRQLPALGNVYQARAITLSNLPLGKTYYWSVQAIDTSFLGSAFATEGSFTIPYRVHLPVVLKDFVNYYANEWETEPNNNYLQSNGPLKSGQIYRGVHNDAKDYYSVYLPGSGTLIVDLSSPIAGTQLQLFYQIADVDHRVAADTVAPFSINYSGAAGWYYIYVYTDPAFVGTQTYTLTVTYP
jgi:hypothetical protein